MTGIGFVSSNKALIIGKAFNWYFKESARFPAKKEFVISRVREGFIFERTDITPWPPNDKIGKIWSSFPEYISRLSPHKLAILVIWLILPLASLIPTIFSIFDYSKQVSGEIFIPVRLGTLYKIIGIETELLIDL